jgi:integrase/recombinase XerC
MPATEPYSIRDFLDYLTFQKRYAANTVISYENDLHAFFEFLFLEYKITDLKEITASIVRTWLASLKENKCSSKTVNRKISALKSFFKYQLKMNQISISPVAGIASLKVSRKLPSFIQEKEIKKLFDNKDEKYFDDSFKSKTDFLIFEILYQTGMRRNELIHLKESDVDKSSGIIKVLGKGNKQRFIPVSNQLLKMIDEYISEKKKEVFEPVEDFLLVNKKGKKLDPKYIYNTVKRNLSQVSTNERKSPHILRHSFATHLTNHGAEINPIKELLGHSSLASTQIYTNNSIEKLKEVYKQAHPKSEE